MMPRDECIAVLARLRGDAVIVAAYSSAFDLHRVSPSPLNFISLGAMGQASAHALGLAIGMPERRIIVLDGDGSLLMNLGGLVTVAAAAPRNLFHFVCANGCYEANGGHPIPGGDRVDFTGLARAAGYAHVFEFDALGPFAEALPAVLACAGPVFATLKVVQGQPSEFDYVFMHAKETRRRFKEAIAAPPSPRS